MKVLLTGHKGYIGAVAAPILQAAGHTITGVDSDLFAGCDFGNGMAEIPELRKDIRDISRPDLEGFDAVVHLAALSNDPLGNLNPEVTFEINHRATARLAELAKAAGVRRFVLSSSCSIYGAAGDAFLDESAELSPVTAYAVSKVRAEHDLAQLGDSHFSPVHLRNATAYGASPRLRLDVVLNDLVASAFTTGRVYVKSDGTPWRPIVHVRDIAAAIVSVLEAPIDADPQRNLQCGPNGGELPRKPTCRDRGGNRPRLSYRIRTRRGTRPAMLSGELREDPTPLARILAAMDRRKRRFGAVPSLSGRSWAARRLRLFEVFSGQSFEGTDRRRKVGRVDALDWTRLALLPRLS